MIRLPVKLTVNKLSADQFETEKYFGSRNDSLSLWLYQRASLVNQANFLRGDPSLLVVHGMEDSLVSIEHTMQLSRVRIYKYLLTSHLGYTFQDLTERNIIFQQQV